MRFKLYTVAAFISVTALVSCAGNKDKDYVDKTLISPVTENNTVQPVEPNATTTQATTQTTNTLPNTTPVTTSIIPGTKTINPVQQAKSININPQQNVVNPSPVTVNTQQALQTTAPGMNPPHGEPGHRCDISVGAPLNSPPGKTNPAPATVTTQQAPATINTQQVQQTVTAPGMNPPHGQPNHRCDIAVGAPLNSPPGPTATPAQTIAVPAKRDSAKN